MKTIVKDFSQFPDDLPLIKINAPKDIKKLSDDELINITTDDNALFIWSIDKIRTQDWLHIKAPNTYDDDDQNFPLEVKHDDDDSTTDKHVENHQFDGYDQQRSAQDAQNDEDSSLTNINHDKDYQFDEDVQKFINVNVEELPHVQNYEHDARNEETKMDDRQDDEITHLRAENKRLEHLLQEATLRQLMMEQFNDEMTDRIMSLEKSAHKKDKTISTLITGQKLLDAGYTATFKSHTQATQDLDDTRIQLYYTQHELDASKVHIMIQDEELDELQNDIKVRNETIYTTDI